jgi:sarcosine oxidase, subunit beta
VIANGTEEWKPILGEAPGDLGFYLNLLPWMGFTTGPISAFMAAELVIGHEPAFDDDPKINSNIGNVG